MFKKNRKKTLISPVLFADNNQVSQKIKRPGSAGARSPMPAGRMLLRKT
jgi:hypothetical protein